MYSYEKRDLRTIESKIFSKKLNFSEIKRIIFRNFHFFIFLSKSNQRIAWKLVHHITINISVILKKIDKIHLGILFLYTFHKRTC